MEIITYVLSGKLEHKDSLGTGSVILPGDGQRMTAGRGIRHSEANPSSTESVHLLQIWIFPDKQGHEPGYEQKSFPESEKRGKLRLIASNDGAEGSVKINQDAKLFVTQLASGEEVTQSLGAKRHACLLYTSPKIPESITLLVCIQLKSKDHRLLAGFLHLRERIRN